MAKVTINSEVVASAKRELIQKITSHIDMDRIREICADLYSLQDIDNVEFVDGDIVVRNGQIAYRMEFSICFSMPILIDEDGNFIATDTSVASPAPRTTEERVEEAGRVSEGAAQDFRHDSRLSP
jgi:hypothetical protein